jgi:hypothetical protein
MNVKVYYRLLAFGDRIGAVHVPLSLPSGDKTGLFTAEPFNAEERKDTMPSRKQRITVYLEPEAYSWIQENANRAGISMSAFCKRVCTGSPVQSMEHRQAVKDILKASGDLGRLGGLFKLALSSVPEGADRMTLQRLLREIDMGQKDLKAAARKIA